MEPVDDRGRQRERGGRGGRWRIPHMRSAGSLRDREVVDEPPLPVHGLRPNAARGTALEPHPGDRGNILGTLFNEKPAATRHGNLSQPTPPEGPRERPCPRPVHIPPAAP